MLAIILHRRDFREYDQMVSLYTKEQGRREVLAKGVKKITSKNAASLEPFAVVEAEIVPGKEVDHLTTVQPIEVFNGIREDLHKLLTAQYALELVHSATSTHNRDEGIFYLLRNLFLVLDEFKEPSKLLLPTFVLQLFRELGFTPVLDRCSKCGNELVPTERYVFDIAGGGVLCDNCAVGIQGKTAHTVSLSESVRQLLAQLLQASIIDLQKISYNQPDLPIAEAVIYQFVVYHGNQKIADWRLLEKFAK